MTKHSIYFDEYYTSIILHTSIKTSIFSFVLATRTNDERRFLRPASASKGFRKYRRGSKKR